ncbi:hypothetical protein VPH35_032936 [Triticum aestivum]
MWNWVTQGRRRRRCLQHAPCDELDGEDGGGGGGAPDATTAGRGASTAANGGSVSAMAKLGGYPTMTELRTREMVGRGSDARGGDPSSWVGGALCYNRARDPASSGAMLRLQRSQGDLVCEIPLVCMREGRG